MWFGKSFDKRGDLSRFNCSHGRKVYDGRAENFSRSAGIEAGDNIVITIEQDTEPRVVKVPADIAASLKEAVIENTWGRILIPNYRPLTAVYVRP